MVAIKAHFDGTAIIPDEPVRLPVNKPLLIRVEGESDRSTQAQFLRPVLTPANRDAAKRLISDPESALENF